MQVCLFGTAYSGSHVRGNSNIDARFGPMPDQFPALAKELQPAVLLSETTRAAAALKQETRMFNFCSENCLQSELVAHAGADNALVELHRDIGD